MPACADQPGAVDAPRGGAPAGNPFSRTLYCDIRVSALLCAVNAYAHAVALGVVLALALYRPLLLLLMLPVMCGCWRQRSALQLRRARSICALSWHVDDRWTWRRRDGAAVEGALVHATVVGRLCVVLHLREQGRKIGSTAVPLAYDSLAPDVHRHLRARLTLWTPAPPPHDPMTLLNDQVARLKSFVSRR